MIINGVDISSLLMAFKKFEKFRLNNNTEQEQAGIIKAFEYTYELGWKTMKRLLEKSGRIGSESPREIFRITALEGLITNLDVWLEFIKARNLTSHTYNQENALFVLSLCPQFSREVKYFLKQLNVPEDAYSN